MYANRNISRGEEISDSYISLLLSREERRELLKPYGFTCRCEACSMEEKGVRESDARRKEIKKVFREFNHDLMHVMPESKSEERRARKDAKAGSRLVQMVEMEGLADFYANAHKIAAVGHAKMRDWEMATKWANMGYEMRVMEDPESGFAMEMFELTSRYIENWKDELRDRSLLS